MLEKLAQLLGLAGLAVGVVYLLYDKILSLPIFKNVGKGGTIFIVSLIAILIWIIAVIIIIGPEGFNVIVGNGGTINSGITVGN